jgi:hypothetical protein
MESGDRRRIVALPLGQAIEIARVLESVVVSLDRVGSREAGGEADVHTLGRFMTEWFVGPRLSSARVALWDAIAQVIGEEAVEEIAASIPAFPDPVPQEVHTLIQERRRWNEEQFT